MATPLKTSIVALLCGIGFAAHAQSSRFESSQLERPQMRAALASLDAQRIVDEWIKLTEIPAPSRSEQARAAYVREELTKLGLADVRIDEKLNVSGVRRGAGGGPSVVFAAHLDTVFPPTTDLTVKRDGDLLRAPGIGDDTAGVIAVLETFRALARGDVQTKGDLIFLATAQEEIGALGAEHWLRHSGYEPDMFLAVDLPPNQVWYGVLRIDQIELIYTAAGAHTLFSRGEPNPVKAAAAAIVALYEIPLPPVAGDVGAMRLPALNVGMISGGAVVNAIPQQASFTVDLRSADSETQERLRKQVLDAARAAADGAKVGFRTEALASVDFSNVRPRQERLHHAVVQTAVATANHFRKPGTPAIVPLDVGSTDADVAVIMGIPAAAIGAVSIGNAHRSDEYADATTIVPGIERLIALAAALAGQ